MKCELNHETAPAFESWLALNANQISSLELFAVDARPMLQLPLNKMTNLERLDLCSIRAQLPGDGAWPDSSPGTSGEERSVVVSGLTAQPALPSLQHLRLSDVGLYGISSLLELTNAPQLMTLDLEDIEDYVEFSNMYHGVTAGDAEELAEAIPRVLQQVPQLSVLRMPTLPFTEAAAKQTAAMQQLRQLELSNTRYTLLGDLRHLHSRVTGLYLDGIRRYASPIIPPELP